MTTAAKIKPFNYDLFRKRVRLFDSDAQGERDLAMHQAIKQCAECEPPLHFWEAAGAAFGGVDRDERARLEERAARAEAEAEDQRRKAEGNAETAARQKEISDRLRQEDARLAEEVRRQKEIGDQLRQENVRLAEEMRRQGVRGEEFNWPDVWFLEPGCLGIVFGFGVNCEWLAATSMISNWFGDPNRIIAEWLHVACMSLFVLWTVALYKCKGLKRLLLSWGIWAGIWGILVFTFNRIDPAFDTGNFAFWQLLIPYRWWATMGTHFLPLDRICVFCAIPFTVDLCEGLPLMRLIVEKLGWVLSAFRDRIDALGH
jgi:hypothetical protein